MHQPAPECVLAGGYIPFAVTRAQRLASGDPRLSIEERYGTLGNYYSAALYQAKDRGRNRVQVGTVVLARGVASARAR